MSVVRWAVIDSQNKPLSGVLLAATSPNGDWQGLTNCAGEFYSDLQPGHYAVTFSKAGYTDRTLPADIQDCGTITTGLESAFQPCPREYAGNMCGVRVPGLPAVPGGAADPSLVLSWFYDRYALEDQARMRAAWGSGDVLLSWPDSRAYGFSAAQFAATCQELIGHGFRPCVMLSAKGYDPPDVPTILANIAPVLPLLTGLVGRFCVGWELSLWLSPTQVQQLIDALAPTVNGAGGKLYVHFQQGYASFQQPGGVFADFWNLNVGKLTGLLHQRDLTWDQPMYQARLVDILERFAGGFGCAPDSGFGHPFDLIALEITAQPQFDGSMDEATGNQWGQVALNTPPVGSVRVMGSGNGQEA
jgi:hypothetical protein